MKTLVVERNGILNNLAVAKERAGGTQVIAAVGGDGMGIGAVKLAKILLDGGIRSFAVESVEEAAALRRAGLVEEQILMLRSVHDEGQLQKLLELNVICTIGSHEAGMALNSFAKEQGTVAEAHVQVDTGMGFGGFWSGDPERILTMYKYLPNVALSGIYTTLHSFARGKNNAMEQLGALHEVVERLEAEGFAPGMVHAAGSYALMNFDYARLDAVRAGSVLLGRCQRSRGDGLTTIGYGECAVEELRWLSAGQTVGGQSVVTVKKPMQVAALPVGFAHGFGVRKPRKIGLWERLFGRKITVEIGGKTANILGGIGTYDTLVDVTGMDVKPGDIAKFSLDPLYAKGFQIEFR